jgi:hypothetical protein
MVDVFRTPLAPYGHVQNVQLGEEAGYFRHVIFKSFKKSNEKNADFDLNSKQMY